MSTRVIYLDENVVGVTGGGADLTNYYTKAETDNLREIAKNELLNMIAGHHSAAAPTTQGEFYAIAISDMNETLELTDKFIIRAEEYAKIFPPTISGNGSVNAFVFNLSNLYSRVKGWREDVMQTTLTRMQQIKAGADATAWQAALDNNVFATPTEDDVAALVDQLLNQGDFRTTAAGDPVVNSVYQYRLEMIGSVDQQLNQFWNSENANSTMYREAERIKIGNSSGSYMHEQIIG
ncbi:MAG: hypothetical protein VW911_05390, partial [Pelagibacteraceae bacterium]